MLLTGCYLTLKLVPEVTRLADFRLVFRPKRKFLIRLPPFRKGFTPLANTALVFRPKRKFLKKDPPPGAKPLFSVF